MSDNVKQCEACGEMRGDTSTVMGDSAYADGRELAGAEACRKCWLLDAAVLYDRIRERRRGQVCRDADGRGGSGPAASGNCRWCNGGAPDVLLCTHCGLDRRVTPGGSAESANGNSAVEAPSGSFDERSAQPPGDLLRFGPDEYPADPAYGIARPKEFAPVTDLAPSVGYLEFHAAVQELLVPKLPSGVTVVTDALGFRGYMLEARLGDEALCFTVLGHVDRTAILSFAKAVALALMALGARGGG